MVTVGAQEEIVIICVVITVEVVLPRSDDAAELDTKMPPLEVDDVTMPEEALVVLDAAEVVEELEDKVVLSQTVI